MNKHYAIVCFLCGVCALAQTQDVVYQQISKSETGLPSNTIYDLNQDLQGYIWLGTEAGLVSYDGIKFQLYHHPKQKGKPLTNLMEDAWGRIWCQNFSGQFFYTQGDSLHYADFIPATNNYYTAQLTEQRYLFSIDFTKQTIRVIDVLTKKIQHIPSEHLNTLLFTSQKNGWFYFVDLTNSLLVGMNKEGEFDIQKYVPYKDYYYYLNFNSTWYFFHKYAFKVIKQGDSTLFCDKPQKLLTHYASIIDSNNVAMLTSTGFYLFDGQMLLQNKGRQLLPQKNISSVLEDREGNWWFGTLGQGIFKIVNPNQVRIYRPSNPDLSLTCLEPDLKKNKIYIGTNANNVFQYDIAEQQWSDYYTFPLVHEITHIMLDSFNDQLWVATQLLYILENQKLIKHHDCVGKDGCLMGKGQMVWADAHNIRLFLPDFTLWNKYGALNMGSISLDSLSRKRAVIGKDTFVYAASALNLQCITPNQKKIITHRGNDISASRLALQGDTLYAATYQEGILVILNEQVIQQILPPNAPVAVLKLKIDGANLWYLTENSIQVYNKHSLEFRIYNTTDGLPAAEFRDFCLVRDTVYLATSQGLVQFPANMPSQNKVPPLIRIHDITNNKQPVQLQDQAEFLHTQNNIEIHFSVMAFKANNNAKVWYSINHQEWTLLENNLRTLQLLQLSTGDYSVRIKAANEDGVESNIAQFSFYIHPPFWQTWWFIGLCGSILLSLVYVIYKYQLRQIESRNRLESDKILLERELQKSILSSIKSQMNPHFIFNALNTIQAYIYMNDKKNASTYLNKFSDLTRMVLDMSNKETIPLSEELKALQLYIELEKIRFEDTFDFQLVIQPNVDIDTIRIPAMVVQPFVENALKHGLLHKKNNRLLCVEFAQQSHCLTVTIDDNGVGRKRAAELNAQKNKHHQSFSSNANQKRLELLNQGKANTIGLQYIDKEDAQHNSLGTTVILTIPI